MSLKGRKGIVYRGHTYIAYMCVWAVKTLYQEGMLCPSLPGTWISVIQVLLFWIMTKVSLKSLKFG